MSTNNNQEPDNVALLHDKSFASFAYLDPYLRIGMIGPAIPLQDHESYGGAGSWEHYLARDDAGHLHWRRRGGRLA